jgi:SagB-type dehydrogenase family enzyme
MARTKNLLHEYQNRNWEEQPSLGRAFHEQSKMTQRSMEQLSERIQQIIAGGVVTNLNQSFKSYPTCPQVELPMANLQEQRSLQDVIVKRRSQRDWPADRYVSQQELANLLQLTYGITKGMKQTTNTTQYLRATPSAGGLYPLELYVFAQRVEDLEPGVYHYRVAHHALEQLEAGDQTERFRMMAEQWGFATQPSLLVVLSGVFDRTMFKYRERGYRFLMMEAGMAAQMVTLLAEAQGLGSCMMGGWVDDELNRMLGLDGVMETSLLPICIGKP